jgi:hypothetical protein
VAACCLVLPAYRLAVHPARQGFTIYGTPAYGVGDQRDRQDETPAYGLTTALDRGLLTKSGPPKPCRRLALAVRSKDGRQCRGQGAKSPRARGERAWQGSSHRVRRLIPALSSVIPLGGGSEVASGRPPAGTELEPPRSDRFSSLLVRTAGPLCPLCPLVLHLPPGIALAVAYIRRSGWTEDIARPRTPASTAAAPRHAAQHQQHYDDNSNDLNDLHETDERTDDDMPPRRAGRRQERGGERAKRASAPLSTPRIAT